ncbi:prolyl oligopeptidase family serine peptidase [Flavobacteriaceae bacterium]|nr:prolyl oligopeptidase family serine peptidase [Flavobacteriaceae bacterium]
MSRLDSLFLAYLTVFLWLGNIDTLTSQSSLFTYQQYINEKGDSLNYRQLLSDYDTNSKYPLVIFLHGAGERGNDNEAQLKWGVKNFTSDNIMKIHPSIVLAPQCPKNMSWGNFSEDDMSLLPSPTKPMQLLIELVKKTINTMPVDVNRVYITGLSMGGIGTFDAISRYPDLFAAAVPVCGGGDVTKANIIAKIPIWVFHGVRDTTLRAKLSQNMINALIKEGAEPGFTLYPEVGHFSWIAAYSDPMMMEWLYRQHK